MDESRIKEKYIQLQMLDQQIKNAQQQVQGLEQQLIELNNVIQSLNDFQKLKEDDLIWVPLATGIYLKARIQDTKEFTVNVGADVAVRKDLESTKTLVMEQIQEVNQVQQQMIVNVEEMVSHAKKLQKLLNSIINESK